MGRIFKKTNQILVVEFWYYFSTMSHFMYFGWQSKDQGRIDCHEKIGPVFLFLFHFYSILFHFISIFIYFLVGLIGSERIKRG